MVSGLKGANLEGANLEDADLTGVNLAGANLHRANLNRVNLTRANLKGANLTMASLIEANVTKADLTRTNLIGINSYGTNLADATFQRIYTPYHEYIKSEEWQKKAELVKELAGQRCQACGRHKSEVTLHAHHRSYKNLGNELPGDLTVLCKSCHELFHNHLKNVNRRIKQRERC
jgi:5-methylcytosine-specific restriction endonuclease McrA